VLKKKTKDFFRFKNALEYIQDFVNIFGLKIFSEEFNLLINSYIDMEMYALLTKKSIIEELNYDEKIPIPQRIITANDRLSMNFTGRLLREILNLTNPRRVMYLESTSAFYEITGKEAIFFFISNK